MSFVFAVMVLSFKEYTMPLSSEPIFMISAVVDQKSVILLTNLTQQILDSPAPSVIRHIFTTSPYNFIFR